MPNGNELVIRVVGDSTQFTRTISQVNTAINRAQGSVQTFGHSSVTSVQAISASLRVAEGNFTGLLRASERFIAQSQALSSLAKTIFPAIGAIAVGSIFIRGAEEAAKFIDQVNRIPNAVKQGYDSFNLSQRSANDALEVTNARLDIEIAKLEGKHENTLALQLAEARKQADDLTSSLAKAAQEQADLLGKNENGPGAQLLGEGTTKYVYGNINNFNRLIAHAARERDIALGNGDQDAADAALGRLHQYQDNALACATQNIQGRQNLQNLFSPKTPLGFLRFIPGDQTANINALTGFRDNILLSQQNERDQRTKNVDTGVQKTLQGQKDAEAKRKELARQAAAALRQQQQEIIQSWNEQLSTLKIQHEVSLGEEYQFWQSRVATAKAGTESYRDAIEKTGQAWQQVLRQQNSDLEDAQKHPALVQPNVTGFFGQTPTASSGYLTPSALNSDENQKYQQEQGKAAVEYLKNLNDGVSIQRSNADAIAEASLQMQIAQGRISGYDAAQVQAQLHTQEYQEQLASLKSALDAVNNDPTLSAIQRHAQASGIRNQIDALNGQRQIQIIQDNAGIDTQTLSGSIRETMNLYVQQATDTAAQIRSILTGAFENVNSSLSHALMAHAYSGREYRRGIENALGSSARGIGSQILNTGFQRAEGGVLKAFGFGGGGKPDGSSSKPFFVKSVDAISAAGSKSLSSIGSMFGSLFGHKSVSPFSSINGTADPLGLNAPDGGGLGFLQGVFASGGDVVANRPAIVGDGGKPEVFVPHTAGHIYPDASVALGGSVGTPSNQVNIHVYGNDDPASTETAIHRAMGQYMSYTVGASVQAVQERQKRRPLSSR
jgi:hypothetical protein